MYHKVKLFKRKWPYMKYFLQRHACTLDLEQLDSKRPESVTKSVFLSKQKNKIKQHISETLNTIRYLIQMLNY